MSQITKLASVAYKIKLGTQDDVKGTVAPV
jgi:hypothetical protein